MLGAIGLVVYRKYDDAEIELRRSGLPEYGRSALTFVLTSPKLVTSSSECLCKFDGHWKSYYIWLHIV